MTANESPTSAGAAPFSIDAARDGDVYRLRLLGEFDIGGIDAAQAALAAALASGSPRLVVDLSGLSFIDSSGLRLVIGARTRCEERGIELSIRRGGPAVQRIFEVTRLERLLPFEDA
jgi:anti-sigma B factor antagonist